MAAGHYQHRRARKANGWTHYREHWLEPVPPSWLPLSKCTLVHSIAAWSVSHCYDNDLRTFARSADTGEAASLPPAALPARPLDALSSRFAPAWLRSVMTACKSRRRLSSSSTQFWTSLRIRFVCTISRRSITHPRKVNGDERAALDKRRRNGATHKKRKRRSTTIGVTREEHIECWIVWHSAGRRRVCGVGRGRYA